MAKTVWILQCKKNIIREKKLHSTIYKSWIPPFAKHDDMPHKKKTPNLASFFFFLKPQHHIQSSGTCINASCTPADLDFLIFSIALCMSSCLIGRMKSSTGLSWDGGELIRKRCRSVSQWFKFKLFMLDIM